MKLSYKMAGAVMLFGAVALSACDDKVLDVNPLDQMSDAAVFADPNLAQNFLNDTYRGIGHGYYGTTLWVLEDDGHNTRAGAPMRQMQGLMTADNLQQFGDAGRYGHYHWATLYKYIRETNQFIAGIDTATFDEARRSSMRAEAQFLRAYYYHNLWKMFGGVPLITKAFGLNDDFQVKRNTFEETMEFIVTQLDSAAAGLPLTRDAANLGRPTRGAALALKARVLMIGASDFANSTVAYVPNITAEQNALVRFASPKDHTQRWQRAQAAVKAVMDLNQYALYKANPAPTDSLSANFNGVWLSRNNPEIIFARYFTTARLNNGVDGPNIGRYDGPNGYHNWGSNTPSGQAVDAFEMADGTKFDWNNPVHKAHPYENRDPRLYATVQFDGEPWVKRPADVIPLEPQGIIQTFSRLILTNGDTVAGVDTHASPIENWNATYTGYYKKKMIDPSVDAQNVAQDVPWIFIRYAEILLDYAECALELGDEATARQYINMTRHRIRMPDVTATGTALRDEYRNERRVEMMFEEQRFFDVRRWMIVDSVNNQNAFGVDITARATNRYDRSTYYDYVYTVISVENRHWNPAQYYTPITRDEMNRNKLLVQNPGY